MLAVAVWVLDAVILVLFVAQYFFQKLFQAAKAISNVIYPIRS